MHMMASAVLWRCAKGTEDQATLKSGTIKVKACYDVCDDVQGRSVYIRNRMFQ